MLACLKTGNVKIIFRKMQNFMKKMNHLDRFKVVLENRTFPNFKFVVSISKQELCNKMENGLKHLFGNGLIKSKCHFCKAVFINLDCFNVRKKIEAYLACCFLQPFNMCNTHNKLGDSNI